MSVIFIRSDAVCYYIYCAAQLCSERVVSRNRWQSLVLAL
jgi:hypothetical protein